jgi:hypothetical protein
VRCNRAYFRAISEQVNSYFLRCIKLTLYYFFAAWNWPLTIQKRAGCLALSLVLKRWKFAQDRFFACVVNWSCCMTGGKLVAQAIAGPFIDL